MHTIETARGTIRAVSLAATMAVAAPAAAQTWQLTGPDGGVVSSVAASSSALLAGAADGVYRSTDRAETWQRMPAIGQAQSMAASPHDPNVFVAASGHSLWRSTDGGATWTASAVGVSLNALQFNPIAAHADELLAIASNQYEWWLAPQLMRSLDGGLSWQPLTGDASFKPLGVTVDPRNGHYFAVLSDGRVMFSINRGASWELLLRSPNVQMPLPSPLLVVPEPLALLWTSNGGWVSELLRYDDIDSSPVWGAAGPIRGLFADPLRSGRIWSAATVADLDEERFGESLDSGATWTPVPSDRNARLQAVLADGTMIGSSLAGIVISADAGRHWTVRSRGIPLAQVNALAGHPADASLIAIAKGGAWVSADRGLTWQAAAGIGESNHATSSVARHPRNPAIALASVSASSPAPRVYRTTNGGLDWQPLPSDSGLFNASLTSIVYDAADPSRISATGSSQLFWSQDGGLHWQEIQSGVQGLRAATAGSSSRLYGLSGSDLGYALLRAERSGEAMTPVVGAPTLGALAVQPTAPQVLLGTQAGDATVAVYLSLDGGDSWLMRGSLPGWPTPLLAFDACDAHTVYAAAGDTLYRSRDRGQTWQIDSADLLVRGATSLETGCAGGFSHVALGSNLSAGVRVRSPVATERIATQDFDPL